VSFRFPKPLRPGSLVAVVAPASPFAREELFRGLAWLRTRYELRMASSILTRTGYLAGDDTRRAAELSAALASPRIEAIVCARGGYGATRILDMLPWDLFAQSPRWLVGFSDVTALHAMATARGIASIHGPNVTGLGRSITAAERLSLLDALERPEAPAAWTGLERVIDGRAEGPVVGGNLALVEAMAAAGRLVVPDGAILVLEDVTERPYRIDRMLTALRLGGYLERAGAIVFGGFTQCEPGPDGVTAREVLVREARAVGRPCAMNAPFGHGAPNHAFTLGRRAVLEGTTLTFL
jgi:muramoyltetrapeptide carboxypeptidase